MLEIVSVPTLHITHMRAKSAPVVKAPTSTGCRACVRIRKKCDELRPQCTRCVKRKKQCPGYDGYEKFIDVGPSLRQRYQTHPPSDNPRQITPSNRSSSSSHLIEQHASSRPISAAEVDENTSSIDDFDQTQNRPASFIQSALLALISPTAYQAQLLSQFIVSLNAAPPATLSTGNHSWNDWLQEIAAHPYSSPLLQSAIRALSLSYMGREFDDDTASYYAQQQYGHALIQLNAILQRPAQASSLETLISVVILSFYEIYNGTDQKAWVRHAGGAARLFQLRGAKMHKSGLAKSTLAAYRPFLVTEGMVARKSSFLNLPSWRSMLQESAEHDKGPLSNSIEDFYLGLGRQSEYFEAVYVRASSATVSTVLELLEWGEGIRTHLTASYKGIALALQDLGLEPAQMESTKKDTPFPIVYKYASSRIGSLYCGYWNALIALNRILTKLRIRLNKLEEDDTTFDGAENMNRATNHSTDTAGEYSRVDSQCKNRLESIECARNICMSIEDLSTSIFLGSMNLVIALRAAMLLLPEERAWIHAQLQLITKHIGLAESATPHDEVSIDEILSPPPF